MAAKQLKRINGWIILGVAACMAVFAGQGCSRGARHKVLTFFFTGVPPLEQAPESRAEPPTEPTPPDGEDAPPARPVLYSHTPFAQRACIKCHRTAQGVRFKLMVRNEGPPVFRKGGGMPGQLIKPQTALCLTCHDAFTSEKVAAAGLWLHAPRADGDCGVCHDPHQSEHPNQMRDNPTDLCLACHPACPVLKVGGPAGTPGCLVCHNAHIGRNRMMLKRDYDESHRPTDLS